MDRALLSLFLIFFHFFSLGASDSGIFQDTAYLRQQIYNGRVWEKRYNHIYGNEFFLTKALTEVSLNINGRTFTGQLCWYDIYNDQLVLMTGPGSYIEANKENIDEFTMVYMDRAYRFVNFKPLGYGHVMHLGKVCLAIRYIKEVSINAVENRYDSFHESQQAYIIRGEEIIKITGKKNLFNALADKETEIKQFLRHTGIHTDIKKPETLIPVLEYYDSL